jgi:dTDP-4-dehydrorhamnose reductase
MELSTLHQANDLLLILLPVTLAPLNEYGRIQAQLERRISKANPLALPICTGALFDSNGEDDSLTVALRRLTGENPLNVNNHRIFSFSYMPDLVHASLDLLVDGERSLWHLVNERSNNLAGVSEQDCRQDGYAYECIIPCIKKSSLFGELSLHRLEP